MTDEVVEYGRFNAQPAPEYDDRESLQADREREIYNSKRVSRPAYTREDPPCECGMTWQERYRPELIDPDDPEKGIRQVDRHEGEDHPWRGTSRVKNAKPGYDQVTFPIVKKNGIARMGEDEIVSPEGSLWRLQKVIGDAKFDLLKQCIAAGVHMVTDIQAEVVVRVEAKTLTDKAGSIVKLKDGRDVHEVTILLPNGEFTFGSH